MDVRRPWWLPVRVPARFGAWLGKLPWQWRSLGGGWIWYYAGGKLSAVNRERFSGWYWLGKNWSKSK
jgi:hypothetical protein